MAAVSFKTVLLEVATAVVHELTSFVSTAANE